MKLNGHPPQLPPERLEQMMAYAVSFPQEERKPGFIETVRRYRIRFAVGGAALAVAASILLVVAITPPPREADKAALKDDVADLMLYDLLEDFG